MDELDLGIGLQDLLRAGVAALTFEHADVLVGDLPVALAGHAVLEPAGTLIVDRAGNAAHQRHRALGAELLEDIVTHDQGTGEVREAEVGQRLRAAPGLRHHREVPDDHLGVRLVDQPLDVVLLYLQLGGAEDDVVEVLLLDLVRVGRLDDVIADIRGKLRVLGGNAHLFEAGHHRLVVAQPEVRHVLARIDEGDLDRLARGVRHRLAGLADNLLKRGQRGLVGDFVVLPVTVPAGAFHVGQRRDVARLGDSGAKSQARNACEKGFRSHDWFSLSLYGLSLVDDAAVRSARCVRVRAARKDLPCSDPAGLRRRQRK